MEIMSRNHGVGRAQPQRNRDFQRKRREEMKQRGQRGRKALGRVGMIGGGEKVSNGEENWEEEIKIGHKRDWQPCHKFQNVHFLGTVKVLVRQKLWESGKR